MYLGLPNLGLSSLGSSQTIRALLFANGEQGVWYDYSDFNTMFQDSAGTTPVTAVGQPVGKVLDKSGRGNHATQATAINRAILQQDASGFYYLAFNGTNSAMATGSIDFTGTSQVSLFAGLKKLSDAAVGFVWYTSANFTLNAGSFTLRAPHGAASGTYGLNVSGATTNTALGSASSYAAPISNVLSMGLDLAAQTASLRVNASSAISSALAVGAGPFGNYVGTIGQGGSGGVFFNGRLYSLIVRGAASSATQIAFAERFVGSKMGIAL